MIKTFVGPMFSGKSDALISVYQKIWNKDLVMAFKPRKDTRDKEFIKSKNYEVQIPAVFIDDVGEIKDCIHGRNIHTIFIDEAEFLTGDVAELVALSVYYDIDFYIAGLNMTSEQKPFGLIGDILAVSDEVENITGFCQDCNKPSRYTFYEPEKSDDVLVGDEGYVSLCPACLRKRVLRRDEVKRLTLTPKIQYKPGGNE